MVFPKGWDNKVKISVFPFRKDNFKVCYNCYTAISFNEFNCFTGLCTDCQKLNPVEVKIPRKTNIRSTDGSNCAKCDNVLKHTNIGICRNVCHTCSNENISIQQRCQVCEKIGKYYWNNICHGCLEKSKFMCEVNGYHYYNEKAHFLYCWCLNQENQILRNKLKHRPPSTIV